MHSYSIWPLLYDLSPLLPLLDPRAAPRSRFHLIVRAAVLWLRLPCGLQAALPVRGHKAVAVLGRGGPECRNQGGEERFRPRRRRRSASSLE